ncbi:hypothetical protein VPNG_00659 [Cytospora leucostoma]|uniref:Hemerythrin-like domain-containing protein n=1 Tax=Cytospora leucostoma TaxID=1230097 RepID=A0A423XLU7_9PEZI|nr:hypothetical protein VPNG_00659 [Cytospora leucostoma]
MPSTEQARPISDDVVPVEVSEAQPVEAEEAGAEPEAAVTEDVKSEPALPPLSAHEYRQYNKLAARMDMFHEHFRQTWTMLYQAASSGRRPAGMSLRQYIDQGLQFLSQLTLHHGIEEQHVFPVLARRMPEFQGGGKGKGKGKQRAAELLRQHGEIHKGMDAMEDYLRRCRCGEADFESAVMKAQMDTWGAVLWKHLDQEVETLRPENMRKYWSLEDIKHIPM